MPQLPFRQPAFTVAVELCEKVLQWLRPEPALGVECSRPTTVFVHVGSFHVEAEEGVWKEPGLRVIGLHAVEERGEEE